MSLSVIMQGLQNVAADIAAEKNRRKGGRAALLATHTNLGNLPAKHAQLIADVNNFIAANPASQAAQVAKNQLDLLTAEFNADKAAALNDVQLLGL